MDKKKVELKDRLREALTIREKKAVDLVRDLKIPKSAISQYLSGKSQNMDSERLYAICRYLDVSEPWMLGFDVPMSREVQKKSGSIVEATLRMKNDPEFLSLVEALVRLDSNKIQDIKQVLAVLLK